MILDAREDPSKANLWQSYGGLETLYSYGANYLTDWASAIPDAHWELRDVLGQKEFEKFAAHCLVSQGASEAEASQIVQKHEEGERARKDQWARETEASRRHEQVCRAGELRPQTLILRQRMAACGQ